MAYNISKNEAKRLGIARVKVNNKSGKSSKSSGGYSDIVNNILKSTPGFQNVLPTFEETYTPELQQEDTAQAKALYEPYFDQKISNILEDLNSWNKSSVESYDRSLRRTRISLAQQGAAIGSERQEIEKNMENDFNQQKSDYLIGIERNIGTEKLSGAGYQSGGQKQEGEIIGKKKEAVQEGQLWYKQQRANRYYGNTQNYYSQPSNLSLSGNKLY